MTKNELENLKKEIDEYEIMVCKSYGDGCTDIGIRRRTDFDDSMLDPVLRHATLLICGDIYDHSHLILERVSNIEDLYKELLNNMNNFCVCLRAVDYIYAGGEEYLLGLYEITDILQVYTSIYYGTEAIKLRVKKI